MNGKRLQRVWRSVLDWLESSVCQTDGRADKDSFCNDSSVIINVRTMLRCLMHYSCTMAHSHMRANGKYLPVKMLEERSIHGLNLGINF